jgi:hypothetical protein
MSFQEWISNMLITSNSDSMAQISTIIGIWLARNTIVFKDTNIHLELTIDKLKE